VTALVLAGGASRRMGADKALLRLPDGRTALAAVLQAAASVTSRVLLAAGTTSRTEMLLAELAPPHPDVLLDDNPGEGPLAALAGALRRVETDGVLLLAVDTPLLQPALLRLLVARLQAPDVSLVQPDAGGSLQPMPAIYARSLAACAAALLAQGRRDLLALSRCAARQARILGEAELRQADPELHSLLSANTPAEWQALLAVADRIAE
jgi:molybdopterin-guanine dinucleotide biosynthesis protein A